MAKGIRSKRMRKNRAVIRQKNAVKERERLIRTVPKSWLQYGGVDLATTEIKDEAFVIDRLKPAPGREPPRVDVFSSLFRPPISGTLFSWLQLLYLGINIFMIIYRVKINIIFVCIS